MAQVIINSDSSKTNEIDNTGTVYSTVRSASTGTLVGENIFIGNENVGSPPYRIYRWFGFFDLSSVPIGSIINSITFQIDYNSGDTTTDFKIVTTGHTAPTTGLTTADFGDLTLNSPIEYSTRSNNVSTLSAGYLQFTLNASGLAVATPGSIFKIALRSSLDVDNTSPSTRSYASLRNSVDANPPQIIVNYTVPSNANFRTLMGVGR